MAINDAVGACVCCAVLLLNCSHVPAAIDLHVRFCSHALRVLSLGQDALPAHPCSLSLSVQGVILIGAGISTSGASDRCALLAPLFPLRSIQSRAPVSDSIPQGQSR